MTVQMTMEEYKELENKAERLDAIREAIDSANGVSNDSLFHREKFFELMKNLGIKVPMYFTV